MEGRPSIHHPLSTYIEATKEKNGMIKTKLKIPYWNRQEPQPPVDLSDEDICIIGSTTVGLTNGLNDTRGTANVTRLSTIVEILKILIQNFY